MSGPELREIRLRRVPVALRRRTSEHHAALRREFALVIASDADGASVPARLLALSEQLSERLAGLGDDATRAIDEAWEAGVDELDLVLHLPVDAAAGLRDLDRLLDEADAHCRSGDHLLTLAEPEDVGRFRRWFLGQLVDQLAGRPPVAWPDHKPAARHSLPPEIDLETAPALRGALTELLHRSDSDVVLDGAGVEFIDSVGIGVLMATYARAEANGVRLWIELASPMLRRVLDTAALTDLLLGSSSPPRSSVAPDPL